MEKLFKCDYCGTTALVTNPKGGCVACGAPIKRENIELLEEKKSSCVMGYSHDGNATCGICSASTLGGVYNQQITAASYIKLL